MAQVLHYLRSYETLKKFTAGSAGDRYGGPGLPCLVALATHQATHCLDLAIINGAITPNNGLCMNKLDCFCW